ncbi:hypothetical protein KIW84_046081 [Lathyrus oleraceus]|uniref:Ribosomal protein/NADH dehydrogenase domain-containing protein n=1 Tax=Pisum sativum TaxID=3888 RepID=A0A9D4XLV0_PEA|nr:hypothetical protein KIW84_046081 [Pisum sativum]
MEGDERKSQIKSMGIREIVTLKNGEREKKIKRKKEEKRKRKKEEKRKRKKEEEEEGTTTIIFIISSSSPPTSSSSTTRKAMAWRGHLSKNIKEIRFLMCQSSPASSSERAFVEKNYKELKTLNLKLSILIRECSGVEPQLWARYDLGIKLEGMTEPQISKVLEDMVKAGEAFKA